MNPTRVQRKRTPGWRMPDNCVSVTRPGPLGNPFTGPNAISNFREYAVIVLSGEAAVRAADVTGFRAALQKCDRAKFRAAFQNIINNNLSVACFCKAGRSCHGDAILELADLIRRGLPLR